MSANVSLSPKVWSVVVDYLADDPKQAEQRRDLIAEALNSKVSRLGPVAVSTVAEVAPLVQIPEDDDA